jgi:hypothetical protein
MKKLKHKENYIDVAILVFLEILVGMVAAKQMSAITDFPLMSQMKILRIKNKLSFNALSYIEKLILIVSRHSDIIIIIKIRI